MKFTVDKKERYCIFRPDEDKLNSLLSPDLKSELVILNQEDTETSSAISARLLSLTVPDSAVY